MQFFFNWAPKSVLRCPLVNIVFFKYPSSVPTWVESLINLITQSVCGRMNGTLKRSSPSCDLTEKVNSSTLVSSDHRVHSLGNCNYWYTALSNLLRKISNCECCGYHRTSSIQQAVYLKFYDILEEYTDYSLSVMMNLMLTFMKKLLQVLLGVSCIRLHLYSAASSKLLWGLGAKRRGSHSSGSGNRKKKLKVEQK